MPDFVSHAPQSFVAYVEKTYKNIGEMVGKMFSQRCSLKAAAMPKTLVIYTHPDELNSHTSSQLAATADRFQDVVVRRLYDLYPRFNIDRVTEQQALSNADHVVLLFPVYWYSSPALLKEWIDIVLEHGWAFGTGGTALADKTLQLAVTTGSKVGDYRADGRHQFTLEEFLRPFEQTARLCHMTWREVFWVPATHGLPADVLQNHVQEFQHILSANSAASKGND